MKIPYENETNILKNKNVSFFHTSNSEIIETVFKPGYRIKVYSAKSGNLKSYYLIKKERESDCSFDFVPDLKLDTTPNSNYIIQIEDHKILKLDIID